MPIVDLAGTQLHYLERGRGPAAVFIHGFPLDATMWLDQIERLADVRRCVAVDLRGFGRSAPVTSDILPMERHAADVVGLLAALDVAAADVVALSMGGYVALALAQLHPDVIRTLALVDTRAEAESSEGKAGRDEAARAVVKSGRRKFAAGMVGALVAPGASPMVKARLRTMIEGTAYESIVASLAGMRDRSDRTAILRRVMVPAAVVVGERDVITPPVSARAMADELPNATLDVIPGAGHMTPMEAPDAVAAVLRDLFAKGAP